MLKWLLMRLPIDKWVVVGTLNALRDGAGDGKSVSAYLAQRGTVKKLEQMFGIYVKREHVAGSKASIIVLCGPGIEPPEKRGMCT
jgi:hypothetical protein